MRVALTRAVSPSLAACELTHLTREPIDVDRARSQHAAYERILASLHVRLFRVHAAPELPDSVFIEDTALVFDELAVIARPGAPSRREETGPVAEALARFRPLRHIEAPATLDGGDVLQVGRKVYVGLSSRTNREAAHQLERLLAPFGYAVVPIALQNCLHLKSAVSRIGERTLLINPDWVPADAFQDVEQIAVAPEEPAAANALWLDGAIIYPAHFPRTAERLRAAGFRVVTVESSELAKAEGAVTCCSIVFTEKPA